MKARTAVLRGVDAQPVTVVAEAGTAEGAFRVEGLSDSAARETRVRVRSGLAGLDAGPGSRTVRVDPPQPRGAVCVDLAVAAVLLATDQAQLDGTLFVGELSLSGRVRAVRGVVPYVLAARALECERVVVPVGQAAVARWAAESAELGVEVLAVETLGQLAQHLTGVQRLPEAPYVPPPNRDSTLDDGATWPQGSATPDLSEIRGLDHAARALEIAAAGRHNVLLIGPPGAGKTMLARRLPAIMEAMDTAAGLAIAAIHSAAGLSIGRTRPFRAPHHTASAAALAGGGTVVRPGEVSLAHNGVLLLDEIAEFRRDALNAIKVAVSNGTVTIGRSDGHVTMPASFLLVGATNPCPCGWHGSLRLCQCSPERRQAYLSRIPWHLFDLVVEVPGRRAAQIRKLAPCEESRVVRGRVTRACARRARREADGLDDLGGDAVPARTWDTPGLTAHVLRVARTIADLAGDHAIEPAHVAEALQYRKDVTEGDR